VPTRYQNLREAVANLAASAKEQVGHLDHIFKPLTGGGSAADYGNDELALELDDIFHAHNDMIWHGELSESEAAAIRPLGELLKKRSGGQNAEFWRREALFNDPRWAEVRACAAQALSRLPDEKRAVGRCG
jgi:hypothetical protein